jgi:hypothetical protein
MPFILFHPKMFYSYTGRKHQKYSIRFPPKKCSKIFVATSQTFCMEKRDMVYAKERIEKNGQVFEKLKQWVL